MFRVPTPPKEPKSASPRSRVHAAGPKLPASTKPKSKLIICIVEQQQKIEIKLID